MEIVSTEMQLEEAKIRLQIQNIQKQRQDLYEADTKLANELATLYTKLAVVTDTVMNMDLLDRDIVFIQNKYNPELYHELTVGDGSGENRFIAENRIRIYKIIRNGEVIFTR